MTPHDALADGQLTDAIAIQQDAVLAEPGNPAKRRFLVDLLGFAGRWDDALAHLDAIDSLVPEWASIANVLRRLLRAERRRSDGVHAPKFHPQPPPPHVQKRWQAMTALRRSRPEDASEAVDEADVATPEMRGFLDGQEFEGLRDADDCYASVLEVLHEGEYVWYAWESLRKVELAPAEVLLDQLVRPAAITLKDGTVAAVHLPLVYPGSHRADGVFALGMETDYLGHERGPTRCIGGKLLLVGDDGEVPLMECRMIEIR